MNIKTLQQTFKNAAIVIAIFGAFLFLLWLMGSPTPVKADTTAQTPSAQASYDEWVKKGCEEKLKPLATAKIDDKQAGLLAEEVDLNDLLFKSKVDCSKAKVVWYFPQAN